MLLQLRDCLTGGLGRDALRQRGLPDTAEFDGFGEGRDGL